MYDQIFGAGAEADFGAPEAQAGGDVVLGLAAGVAAPGFFVEGVGDPGRGPDLAVVGVAAELEVDAGLFGFFKMVRLVVEQNGESCRLRQLCMLRQLRQLLFALRLGDGRGYALVRVANIERAELRQMLPLRGRSPEGGGPRRGCMGERVRRCRGRWGAFV